MRWHSTPMANGSGSDAIYAFVNGKFWTGNAGRNILRAPGCEDVDFSVAKNTTIKEGYAVQFRAEVFNLTNTPHFNNPSGNASGGDFGYITTAADDQRFFRLALRLSF